jgi:tripartite-type tricarboxylate transporter receptor subunit TctC
MNKDLRSVFAFVGAACALLCQAGLSLAQDYPSKPITIIVPFAAGGPAEALSRTVASALSKQLRQTILIENVGGASGNIGAVRAARAVPDGYTLLYHNLGMATAPLVTKNLEFNPLTDFDPIGLVAYASSVLVTRADFPTSNFKEFLAYVRANQAKITMGDAGLGTASNLCGMLFMAYSGTRLTQVMYKGSGPAFNDVLGGRIDMMCNATATIAGQIKSGKVKAIGLTANVRNASLPDLLTLDEQGFKGFEALVWQALFAPRNTSHVAMDRLVSALQTCVADPEMGMALQKIGFDVVPRERATPAALQEFLKSEIEKWGGLFKKYAVKQE